MNSKPIRWTAAQKAAAFDTTADDLVTATIRLTNADRRFASRLARARGVPRDVFLGTLVAEAERGAR